MSGQTAWTATVWGQGKLAMAVQRQRKLRDGEEECFVCRNDVPASVALQPCSHKVCVACVENLRAKNIFRADKGVTCPFCRQPVEHYSPVEGADPSVMDILMEANRAAAMASAARVPKPAARAPSAQAFEKPQDWLCTKCNNLNLAHREVCNMCKCPNPKRPAASNLRASDILKVSTEQLIEYLTEKMHPNLNQAFSDMGINFSQGRVVPSKPENVLACIKQGREKRMMRIFTELVADSSRIHEVVQAFYGNYSVQDLVEAGREIRNALRLPGGEGLLASFKSSHRGMDPLGALHHAFLAVATDMAGSERGTYVLQKLAQHCDPEEVCMMAARIFPQGPELACDGKGVYTMLKTLEALRTRMADDALGMSRLRACEEADALCAGFITRTAQQRHCIHNYLGSKVLVQAISVGLPRHNALQLGSRLASTAASLVSTKHGIYTLVALTNELVSLDATSDELVRDIIVTLALKLQGMYAELVLGRLAEDRGSALVRQVLVRLSNEQEVAWLDSIINELINKGDEIVAHDEALETVKQALISVVMPEDMVLTHLQQLGQLAPDHIDEITSEIFSRRAGFSPPPAKYFGPSVIQPDLPYHLRQGFTLMPPPAPPPRPGAAQTRTATSKQAAHTNAAPSASQQDYSYVDDCMNDFTSVAAEPANAQGFGQYTAHAGSSSVGVRDGVAAGRSLLNSLQRKVSGSGVAQAPAVGQGSASASIYGATQMPQQPAAAQQRHFMLQQQQQYSMGMQGSMYMQGSSYAAGQANTPVPMPMPVPTPMPVQGYGSQARTSNSVVPAGSVTGVPDVVQAPRPAALPSGVPPHLAMLMQHRSGGAPPPVAPMAAFTLPTIIQPPAPPMPSNNFSMHAARFAPGQSQAPLVPPMHAQMQAAMQSSRGQSYSIPVPMPVPMPMPVPAYGAGGAAVQMQTVPVPMMRPAGPSMPGARPVYGLSPDQLGRGLQGALQSQGSMEASVAAAAAATAARTVQSAAAGAAASQGQQLQRQAAQAVAAQGGPGQGGAAAAPAPYAPAQPAGPPGQQHWAAGVGRGGAAQGQSGQQRQGPAGGRGNAPVAAAPPAAGGGGAGAGFPPGPWSCAICTYEHKGGEEGFLTCGICGVERGRPSL